MYWGTAEMLLGSVYFILHLAFICQKLEAEINLLVIELVFKKLKTRFWENKLKVEKHIENNFSNFWCAEKLITKNQYLIKSQMPKSQLLSQNTKTYISNNQTLSTTRGNNIYPSLNLPRMKVVLTMHNMLGVHAFFTNYI